MSTNRRAPLAALVFLGALLTSGCSDAFDPFVETEPAFALFGFLDARQDTQFVRVQPITGQDATAFTARVTSTALATGEQIAWRDSLVQLDDGSTGTVYVGPFRPEPGVTYRIEATPQEVPGAASVAVVTVPAEAELRVPPPIVGEQSVTQVLGLEGALRPRAVRATYTVQRTGGEPLQFGFNYSPRPAADGFEVLVVLLRDASTIRTILGIDPEGTERPALLDLELDYDLVSEAQPTPDGLGSFGSAASFTTAWTLAPQAVSAIGFVDAQGEE